MYTVTTTRSTTINLRKLAYILVFSLLIGAAYYAVRYTGVMEPKQVVVCIDPGHPSETNPGRTPQHGTCELEMNWAVAKKLEAILRQDPRIKVVMTREDMDETMPNWLRAVKANNCRANIAVHLHCDAGPSRGFTLYYPDRQVNWRGSDMPSQKVLRTSREAAATLHFAMAQKLEGHLRDRGIKGEKYTYVGRKHGLLSTSLFSEVPTVTVEMVFLNNRGDAEFIKSEMGQSLMARALADGILDYVRADLEKIDPR